MTELKADPDGRAHKESVEALAFSPTDPLLVSASSDGKVRLWQYEGMAFRELVELPSASPVVAVRFHPDGKRLAVLAENERAVRVWHLDRLRERFERMGLGW